MMNITVHLIVLSLIFTVQVNSQVTYEDDIIEMIQTAGYQSEVHKVETEDGYILKVHRVLVKKQSLIPRKPVFMMHGLLSTAMDYVFKGPDKGLAFLLSDNGYDIWLGNSRGSKHSMQHKTLDIDMKDYWNFSFHEIGYFDLPAMIDYMLMSTNQTQFFSVGYSQGTSATMVMLTNRPEYNQKIIQTHLVAPAIFLKHLQSPGIKLLAKKRTQQLIKDSGMFKNPPVIRLLTNLCNIYCKEPIFFMCQSVFYYIFGPTTGETEMSAETSGSMVPHISPFFAIKQILHFLQLVNSGHFQPYDYFQENIAFYNSSDPPEYNISNVIAPVYIYRSDQDYLISKIDVDRFKSLLPNVRFYQEMKNFNHLDMMYGKNARKIFHLNILKAMNSKESE